jgi:hypothetical protein
VRGLSTNTKVRTSARRNARGKSSEAALLRGGEWRTLPVRNTLRKPPGVDVVANTERQSAHSTPGGHRETKQKRESEVEGRESVRKPVNTQPSAEALPDHLNLGYSPAVRLPPHPSPGTPPPPSSICQATSARQPCHQALLPGTEGASPTRELPPAHLPTGSKMGEAGVQQLKAGGRGCGTTSRCSSRRRQALRSTPACCNRANGGKATARSRLAHRRGGGRERSGHPRRRQE